MKIFQIEPKDKVVGREVVPRVSKEKSIVMRTCSHCEGYRVGAVCQAQGGGLR